MEPAVSDESGSGGFPVPSGRHRVEEVVRGSRFITTVAHAPDEEAAQAFVDEVRAEFPDATHNCWAFLAGPPGTTARIGMSDDGEPHRTAGRPMLETLLHSGVGEVAAVVTRYFGGTKLGRGGLGRAYAGGVKLALETLQTRRRVIRERVRIEVGYPAVDALFRFLDEVEGVREEEEYGEWVRIVAGVPGHRIPDLERAVAEMTGGSGRVER
jgi:uncharacterized YigZ family protein